MEHYKAAYPIPEAGKLIGIGRSKTYQEIKSGELRSFYIGKRHLVAAEDIDAYVSKRRAQSEAEVVA